MSSTGKTTNLGLNQWELTDPFLMEDFNEDNAKIDEALGEVDSKIAAAAEQSAFVSLMDVKLTAASRSIELDFSNIDLSQYASLEMRMYLPHSHTDKTYLCATMNDITNNVYASASDWTIPSQAGSGYFDSGTLQNQMRLSYMSKDAGYNCGYTMTVSLVGDKAPVLFCDGANCASDGGSGYRMYAWRYISTMSDDTVTAATLNKIKLYPDSGNFKAGARITVHGVRL